MPKEKYEPNINIVRSTTVYVGNMEFKLSASNEDGISLKIEDITPATGEDDTCVFFHKQLTLKELEAFSIAITDTLDIAYQEENR